MMASNDGQGPVVLGGADNSNNSFEVKMESGFDVAQATPANPTPAAPNPGNAPGAFGTIPGSVAPAPSNAPGGTVANQPSTPPATPAAVQFDSSSGQPIRLPAGTSLENIEIVGKNIVIKQAIKTYQFCSLGYFYFVVCSSAT